MTQPQPKPDLRAIDKTDKDSIERIRQTHTEELIVPLCGPIGTPLHDVANLLKKVLEAKFGYEVVVIKYSDIIRKYKEKVEPSNGGQNGKQSKRFQEIRELIDGGNKLREKYGNSILSEISIKTMSIDRIKGTKTVDNARPEFKTRRVCYILDSLKNADELSTLRYVYTDLVYFFGVFSPLQRRVKNLSEGGLSLAEIHQLIDRDSGEEIVHGQAVRETFMKADFFLRIDSDNFNVTTRKIERLLHLIFGTQPVTPTIHETSMYLAASASGNSACLSRQVGASITDRNGEVLSVGWNDVPQFGGDLYQNSSYDEQDHENDKRCINIFGGKCFNDAEKNLISTQIVDMLIEDGLVTKEKRLESVKKIRGSKINSLVEFSRAIHAEMHAIILGAQKSGSKMKGGKLFCTTYPCHICARHIIVAGIEEVYYIEPYTKSLTTKLHFDAITEDEESTKKVRILMFDGVSPSKYLFLFKNPPNSRKKGDGSGEAIYPLPKEASPKSTLSLESIPVLESVVVKSLQSKGITDAT